MTRLRATIARRLKEAQNSAAMLTTFNEADMSPVMAVRARYKAHRDAMRAALERHMPAGCRWNVPSGGMFFWVELPEGMDATALLPKAVERGMAYVPGAAFFADHAKVNTLRLSFVTVPPQEIEQGVALLAQMLKDNA